MRKNRKFYRNVVTIEVLTEDEPLSDDLTLEDIGYEIENGGSSGGEIEIKSNEVPPAEMARLLIEQGSDPSFFLLNEDGTPYDGL